MNNAQDDIESIRNAMGLLSERMHIMQKEITKLQAEVDKLRPRQVINGILDCDSTESQ